VKGLVAERYGILQGGCYLIRPDQYVAGRWRQCDVSKITSAVQRSIGKN